MTFEARAYQTEAVQNLRSGLASGFKRQILSSPTGSGKTEIGMILVRGAVAKGKRVAFLCNRINLVGQTSARFFRAGIAHGVIQGANTSRTYESVIVASIQTVAKRGLPPVDLLVIDEAHGVAGSKDYRKVIAAHNGPVVGLSATPFSKGLGKSWPELGGPLFEQMVIAATIQDLIDQGYLVDCDVYAPSQPDLTGVKITAGDYNERELGEAVDKPVLIGDIVTNWRKYANGTPTVCFATNISHSQHIVQQFLGAGVAAEHIDCYTSEEDRAAILERVASGKTLVISNVGILTEGWDFPACRTMILARPTKSLIRYLQMAGRVLRPAPGKDRALILDHSGTVQTIGFPTDDFPMELDDGKPKEQDGSDKKKKEEKKPTKCPQCTYLKKSGGKCPVCGFQPQTLNTTEHLPGELTKLEGKKKLSTDDKRRLYKELVYIANERQWSDGRLANVFRDLAGTWPNSYKNEGPKPPSAETLKAVQYLNIKFAKSKGHHAAH
jgi:superfamily II DNA or RNA helicase